MKVIFFNHWHNGDIHVSRGLVRQIMKKIQQIDPSASFMYSHKNAATLLSDIPNLGFDPIAINHIKDYEPFIISSDTIYINTWYGQNHRLYLNQYGMTFDTLYVALNDTCKKLWGFTLTNISSDPNIFFPIIDYSKFHIQEAQSWLYLHPEKKILIENGNALSGQATNFPMTPIITNLAVKYPNYTFILTNMDGTLLRSNNVIYSSNIIKKSLQPDLNEISFLSRHCDVIIGRASGPFTFTLTQDNLFIRHPKFICFSNLMSGVTNKFWINELFRNIINYSAEFIVTNECNINMVAQLIVANL